MTRLPCAPPLHHPRRLPGGYSTRLAPHTCHRRCNRRCNPSGRLALFSAGLLSPSLEPCTAYAVLQYQPFPLRFSLKASSPARSADTEFCRESTFRFCIILALELTGARQQVATLVKAPTGCLIAESEMLDNFYAHQFSAGILSDT